MAMKSKPSLNCDVLVIGSGGAGLRAAIAAAQSGADVLMVSKARTGHSTNTYLSKAVLATSGWGDPEDGPEVHTSDTLSVGRGLNDPVMVEQFTSIIPEETARLKEWGVLFNTDEEGNPCVIKIPGHRYARHVVGQHWQGRDLVLPLKQKAMASGVRFEDRLFVAALIAPGDAVAGAVCISSKHNAFMTIQAKSVILATGGFGHLFLNCNNAPGICGDGHALAGALGIPLQDMEFVQFYPTAQGKHGRRLLLYERLLCQEGVSLRNRRGEDILKKNGGLDPAEVSRDQLARLMMKEVLEDPQAEGTLLLDFQKMSPETAKEVSNLLPAGWTKGERIFEVTPTTHFCMGGVCVDVNGETARKGLFAAGEVTAGAHGANRLGGNALAEIFAMGSRVGRRAAESAAERQFDAGFESSATDEMERLSSLITQDGPPMARLVDELKRAMWLHAGIVRSRASLETALQTLLEVKAGRPKAATMADLTRYLELKNMLFVGEAVCRSALERTETRGAHFRADFPEEDDANWMANIQTLLSDDRNLQLRKIPVP